jgi:hypothetical protein
MVGYDPTGQIHLPREGRQGAVTALCKPQVVASALLQRIHEQRPNEQVCDRCSAIRRALNDEGATTCSA